MAYEDNGSVKLSFNFRSWPFRNYRLVTNPTKYNVAKPFKDVKLSYSYKTKDGTAKVGVDYEISSGKLPDLKEEGENNFSINIFVNDTVDTERYFYVELYNPRIQIWAGNPRYSNVRLRGAPCKIILKAKIMDN